MAPGDDSMKSVPKRQLGSTGIDVSCLGLGTVKLGRNQGVKYPRHFDLPNDEQVIALLDQARGLGINFIDTAPAYGSSEERLGKLMQNRQDWIICSKVGEEFEDGVSHFDFSAQHTRRSVERSLRRLRTDYLDLVLIHSNGEDLEILEQTDCLETLLNLKDEGLIRAVGMSTKTVIGGKRALPLCDALMLTFNATTTAEEPVIDLARAQGKAILVKKAFDSGHATDQPGGPEQALGFVLSKPGVSSVIVGTINPEHLRSNAEIAAGVILS
jgi:aryl-alcohol dehydrogenase-like predicted oxidoreductase